MLSQVVSFLDFPYPPLKDLDIKGQWFLHINHHLLFFFLKDWYSGALPSHSSSE